jgi:hypothetical protein
MDEIGNHSANLGAGAARIGARPGKPKGHPKPPGSGRQKGTPNRITRDIREAAAKHSAKAIAELARLLKDEDSRVRVAAARELLDRAHGKPITPTEISGKDGAPIETHNVTDIDVGRRIAFVLARAAKDTPPAEPEALPDPEPQPTTWYNATTPPEPKPAQVIPPEPNGYHYEPTAEEVARREFDAHINRASNRAMGGATSHPKVITQRPR